MEIDAKLLERMFSSMLYIRRVEEYLASIYKTEKQEIRCPIHLSIGQEAAAVGVSVALKNSDTVYSNHRAHAHYLAKGASLKRMFAELYGKATGCSGGRGGSMHLIDVEAGFFGAVPLVAATVPLAVGSAWAHQLNSSGLVSVVYFGDGGFEEGVIHEAMNFSVLHSLPVIFVCENNLYSVYTRLSDRQPDRPISGIAQAHGCHTHGADGNDVEQVYSIASKAVESARNGLGPQFIELQTYRWLTHCGPEDDDHLGYRPIGELAEWQKRCPVERSQKRLEEQGILDRIKVGELDERIRREIHEAVEFARNSPEPSIDSMDKYVYAN